MKFALFVAMAAPIAFAAELPLMPVPSSAAAGAGALPITSAFSVSIGGAGGADPRVEAAAECLFARLTRATGMPLPPDIQASGGTLRIVVEKRSKHPVQTVGDDESYSLDVKPDGARLSANEPLGAARGIETFVQLVQQNPGGTTAGYSAIAATVQDQPRFPWRGLSLDVSRHFIPLDGILRTLDGMSAVKLNVLHWHLSDDQGFRIESKKYPRLQRFGSDGLFYTQAEVKQTIAYARDRGIRIVPEFDMPAHATSWLPGYPALAAREGEHRIERGYGVLADLMDPTKEGTYRFLDGFVGEMSKLFPDEYFHIGGDEVAPHQWNANPRIQAFMRKHRIGTPAQLQVYFNQRLLKIVTKHGKQMEGWDEILQPDLPKSVVVQSWRGQESLWQAAREGYQGILSAGWYLDLSYPASYHYAIDPLKVPAPPDGSAVKPGSPATGTPADLTPEQRKSILGGEAAMWEELADSENIDSRLWPRLAAIAERLWSPEDVTDTASMYRRLAIASRRLELFGLTHRSNLELMRERLAGNDPMGRLDVFAEILEPVKGYSRHAQNYSSATPLNRLVDAVPPESDTAREFRDAVSVYLGGSHTPANSQKLRDELQRWAENAAAVQPLLQNNSLLNEDLPIASDIAALCSLGQQAIAHLDANQSSTPPEVKSDRHADLLIQIAPAIQQLAAAEAAR